MQIRWKAQLNKRRDCVLGLANSFSVEIIHNMRTVKQLASETEFLRQFSDLVLEEFKIHRNDLVISPLLQSLYWGTRPLIEVFAYYIFALESVRCITTLTRQMSDSLSAAQSFFSLFDRTSAIDNSSTDGQQLVSNSFRKSLDVE
ncbi:unnamed protein product [Rotaria sordida]|uniref:Uncharacterized protein n=1 Tax=Rotaria sordida TaxID=392033 RepID=A0A814RCQ4_9BILA|nr:unnamed protein product [Rotaria sordida]